MGTARGEIWDFLGGLGWKFACLGRNFPTGRKIKFLCQKMWFLKQNIPGILNEIFLVAVKNILKSFSSTENLGKGGFFSLFFLLDLIGAATLFQVRFRIFHREFPLKNSGVQENKWDYWEFGVFPKGFLLFLGNSGAESWNIDNPEWFKLMEKCLRQGKNPKFVIPSSLSLQERARHMKKKTQNL